jgi:hypothetical protein
MTKKLEELFDLPEMPSTDSAESNEALKTIVENKSIIAQVNDAIDKIDTSNCDKAIIDMIIERCYEENDNIVHKVHSERIGTCEKYWDGKISFYIKNKD